MSAELTAFSAGHNRRLLSTALIVVGALILGIMISRGMWLWLGVLAAVPLVVIWPVQVALGTFAILVPFDSVAVLGNNPTGTTLTWFAGVAAGGVLFAKGLVSGRLERPSQTARWWLFFLLWCSVTALWALDQQAALERFPTAWSLLVFYLVATSFRITKPELRWISALAIVGGCLAAAYAASQFYQGHFYHDALVDSRASLILGQRQTDPNYFATSLLLPISIAIGAFFSLRSWIGKVVMVGAAVLMTYGVFLTMSRGALVALAVIVLFYIYRLRPNIRIVALVPVFLALLAFLPGKFWERLQFSELERLSGRRDVWTVGATMLKHYGIFGTGLENFPVAYSEYAGYAPSFVGYHRAPHNTYLGVWIELGCFGLLLFLIALRSQFRDAKRSRDHTDPAGKFFVLPYEAACFGLLVSAMSVDLIWTKVFWLSWILLAIAVRSLRDEAEAPKSEIAFAS